MFKPLVATGFGMMVQQEKAKDAGSDFLLIKRGHRGRYRITLRLSDVRVTGDVTLDANRASKSNDAIAINRFLEALSTLADRLKTAQIRP